MYIDIKRKEHTIQASVARVCAYDPAGASRIFGVIALAICFIVRGCGIRVRFLSGSLFNSIEPHTVPSDVFNDSTKDSAIKASKSSTCLKIK